MDGSHLDLAAPTHPDPRGGPRAAIAPQFPGLHLEGAAVLSAQAQGLSLGAARIWRMRLPGPIRVHSNQPAAPQRNGFVALRIFGTSTLTRDGITVQVSPGQLALGKTANGAFEMVSPAAVEQIIMDLPWSMLLARHPQLQHCAFQTYEADEPGVALVGALLKHTLEHGHQLDPLRRGVALEALLQLFGVLAGGIPTDHDRSWRVSRALADIRASLADGLLSASRVAEAQRISRRRLDEILIGSTGHSIAGHIAEQRLLRAAELLRDPEQAHRSITDIAFSIGFQDSAHFSRTFKARWQATPSQWRLDQGVRSPRSTQPG